MHYELQALYYILSGGSVDKRFATCAAEESKPSKSAAPSSDRSPTSNPDTRGDHYD